MSKKFLLFFTIISLSLTTSISAQQPNVKLKKKDRKRDIELVTTEGTIVLRLYDSTPLHRDNFLKLVKSKYYDSVLFHRVIKNFMIQSGDPESKRAVPDIALGKGGLGYTVPAEIRTSLFHQKGALAAARMPDNVNPEKASSSTQFYIVHGRTFTDHQLDSIEIARLKGHKLPQANRDAYKTIGGVPHLDQGYTVFGKVVKGIEVVDKIASTATKKEINDRPMVDARILKARLVKRKRVGN